MIKLIAIFGLVATLGVFYQWGRLSGYEDCLKDIEAVADEMQDIGPGIPQKEELDRGFITLHRLRLE